MRTPPAGHRACDRAGWNLATPRHWISGGNCSISDDSFILSRNSTWPLQRISPSQPKSGRGRFVRRVTDIHLSDQGSPELASIYAPVEQNPAEWPRGLDLSPIRTVRGTRSGQLIH
jgi:hypothetical protein